MNTCIMARTTIPVDEEIRDRIRELKGFDRTYSEFFEDEVLSGK